MEYSGTGGEVLRGQAREAVRVQPGGEQRERAVRHRGQPVEPEQPPRLAVERVPDLRRRRLQLARRSRVNAGSSPWPRSESVKLPSRLIFSIDLVVADEGALAADPEQVALPDQVEQRLADRRQADAEVLGVLALVRDLLAGPQAAALDLILQQLAELVVQRHRRAAADRQRQLGQRRVGLGYHMR